MHPGIRLYNDHMLITTPSCIVCHKTTKLTIPRERFDRWQKGEMVQRAFYYMSSSERELLMTGIHEECWDSMFAED